ncbi:MAG: hypothetical protein AAGE52_36015, partial [Myxococcota bacterium]
MERSDGVLRDLLRNDNDPWSIRYRLVDRLSALASLTSDSELGPDSLVAALARAARMLAEQAEHSQALGSSQEEPLYQRALVYRSLMRGRDDKLEGLEANEIRALAELLSPWNGLAIYCDEILGRRGLAGVASARAHWRTGGAMAFWTLSS